MLLLDKRKKHVIRSVGPLLTKNNFFKKQKKITKNNCLRKSKTKNKDIFKIALFIAFFKFQTQIFLSFLVFSPKFVFFDELQTYFCSLKKNLTPVP